MKYKMIKNALLVTAALFLAAGCGNYGEVKQGRAVAYDAAAKKVTFIEDSGTDDRNPIYEVLPPLTFDMPKLEAETGPIPNVGLRMKLDLEAKVITMYNTTKGAFEKISFELVGEQKGVDVRKQHPLVYDAESGKPREFPVVDMDKSELTLYTQRLQELVTIKVPKEALYRYKASDWNAGDEIRIYYKQDNPAQILRFMNISKTDIYKK